MAKITITLFFILISTFCSFAQAVTNDHPIPFEDEGIPVIQDKTLNPDEEIFMVVEQKPEFPGGEKERIRYLLMNINYPEEARLNGIDGTVYVTFVIEKSGEVSNVRIIRGIGGGCDEEVVRLIEAMPNWIAGQRGGQPVRVQYTMPVKYNLTPTFSNTDNEPDTTYNPDDKIYEDADQSAEFPGGTVALHEFIAANIEYPQYASESGIKGTVYVTFVVEKSGRVNHVEILRGIGGFCDEEVLRVIKAMPRWKAALKKDKPVRTRYNMPVKFTQSDAVH